MMITILLILAAIAGAFWLFNNLLINQDNIVLYWAGNNYEITTAKFLAVVLVTFLAFYLLLRLIKHLFSLRKYTRLYRERKVEKRTQNGLLQGLISLIEGNWNSAKTQLLADAEQSKMAVLHYLGAARAAHMQEAFEERDQYLKRANEISGGNTEVAIAISQAEMQLYAGQLEQARAGLVTLLETHPKHRYAKKLLAKSYYKQEDWKNLSSMLPEMQKQDILNKKEWMAYETASLKGIFQMYASEDNLSRLKAEWKKLPAATRNRPTTILFYSKALLAAGDNTTANKLMVTTLNKQWDDKLAEWYGLSSHDNINQAIRQAEKWLPEHDKSPVFLLSLARLYRKNQLWGKARHFFEASLNLAPNAQGYLEFAELLEETGEKINAQLCYKTGLNYCIHKKGQPLTLHSRREASRVGTPLSEASMVEPPISDYVVETIVTPLPSDTSSPEPINDPAKPVDLIEPSNART